MTQPALTAEEVLAWLDKTSTNWCALIEEHPEILNLPISYQLSTISCEA